MNHSALNKTLIATLIATILSPALAEKSTTMLPEIVVYGEQNQALTSSQSVNQDKMKKTPTTNGNITDYLRDNPHVRYETSDQDGFQRGEIKPENISINGADSNQTAYFVDNVNVNNELSIDSEIFDGAMQVLPGISHTQAYFFDANMLSKVEVQDSNVSASLGGFMGGAVVAKTKQYDGKDRLRLKYRTTRSNWASLNEDASSKQILERVRPGLDGSADLQPRYKKQTFSLTAEKGLTDNLGVVFGFSRRDSNIAQYRLIGFDKEAKLHLENHTRRSDNLLLNVNWQINDNNRLELSTRYSNYMEKKYSQTNIDSNVKDYHTAYGATLAWIRSFNSGVWTNTLAYDKFQDKRKSQSNEVETVNVEDENNDPLYDYEKGGYGDSQLTQQNIHYSTEYALEPFSWGNTNHSISVGGLYQASFYAFNRDQDVNAQFGFGEIGNITLTPLSTTPKGQAKTSYQNIALYGEDLVKWKDLEVRLGLRFERDDYLKNNNLAPRFVAKYQPWSQTAFTFGLNRYYGRSFSSLKLTNEILKINRDTSNIRDFTASGKLKTPYADELSFNVEQEYGNALFKLGYIHRENKDRIILKRKQIGLRPSGDPEYTKFYANGNPFKTDIYTFQVQNMELWQLGMTYWNTSFAFDWLHTKRADFVTDINPNELVYLDGKLMTRQAMRQKVNSSTEDWIARVGLDMNIPKWNLSWSNKVYMKAPIRGYNEIDGSFPDDIPRFRSFHYGKHTQWDSSIRWQPTIAQKHQVYVQLDVLNVLNQTRKIRTVKPISSQSEYSIYTPGREFWLEVGYEF
ncbi:TonB-dependent receptor plug domain-containing protein [[Haemophilus] felis]|uniref:TonB-dependent receptor n=1 Tax=[Haemophilus] felis TaxID=123822 RepID=A0A1T0AXU8_9PAST|nr:TonB-dependent receptor plug domain-containing protein [[Haemophilus] felis]NBI41286.1 TonB-dependent receptor plug domain-containing protein [[Haemophilus] felis]OOS02718.1 TonB-dependent receptor [[Haemophilus] felis]